MKIIVLTGSPHKNGSSALLTERFIAGAQKAGHDITRFDAAFEEINFCLGCDHCKQTGKCVHKDAMEILGPELVEADGVVFSAPLYYHDVPAQLKAVIDRFYRYDEALRRKRKKAALLVTAYQPGEWVMKPIVTHYETTLGYLGWQDTGRVLALGCGTRSDLERTSYPEAAYELGIKF